MVSTYGGRWSSSGGVPVEDVLERRLLDKLGGEVNRYQDKEFLKATMAVCALTALADEEVSLEERRDIDQAIRLEPSLAEFNLEKANKILDSYIFELTRSCEAGKNVEWTSHCRLFARAPAHRTPLAARRRSRRQQGLRNPG